ncbi:MAG: hypothetical protein IKO49_06985 [Bacilli bacterium]|nr:hypothetical protein [Bacilli bacterium]
MIDIAELLTSTLAIYIYIGIIIISFFAVVMHVFKNSGEKRRKKQNTKELNDYVNSVIEDRINDPIVITPEKKAVMPEVQPVTIIDNSNKEIDVVESIKEDKIVEVKDVNSDSNMTFDDGKKIEVESAPIVIEEKPLDEPVNTSKKDDKEELVYAPIELNKEEAKEELERLTKELEIKAELEKRLKEEELKEKEQQIDNNITLTNFEKEQEENAIISIDELMSKANDIYSQNEDVQYEDEGNEPISIQDLQAKWEAEQQMIKQIEKEEQAEIEVVPIVQENNSIPTVEVVEDKKTIKQVAFPSILPTRKEAFSTSFENSPIISPIYGIERSNDNIEEHSVVSSPQELQLENTANYEKFDEEIRKTNEFIATLKELQKKLD